MDPLQPPQDAQVPFWLWKAAGWLVAGLFTVLTTLLGWLGKRHVEVRDRRIEEVRDRQDKIVARLDEMSDTLSGDHEEVNGGLVEIKTEIQDLSEKIEQRT